MMLFKKTRVKEVWMTKRGMKKWQKKHEGREKLPWSDYTIFFYFEDIRYISYATKNKLIDEYHNVFTKMVEFNSSAYFNMEVCASGINLDISEQKIAQGLNTALSQGYNIISFANDFGKIYIAPGWLYDDLKNGMTLR